MGIRTYDTLYSSYVVLIMNYAAGVCGFADFTEPQTLQNRIMRYFLGVHKFAPIPAISIEMDWMCTRFMRWIEMIRFRNRLASMEADRLPRMIYKWDSALDTDAWARSVVHVLQYVNLLEEVEDVYELKHVDLDVLNSRLRKINCEKWWLGALDMPKLRTFKEIYDEQDHRGIVYSNMTRRQRSLVTKFKIGILPLGLETGRFTDVPLENRLRCICEDGLLDDEYHFLLYCEGLKDIHSKHFAAHTYLEDVEDPTDKDKKCMTNS